MSGLLNHVLYLSHDGLTDPLGQSQILPYVIGLSAAGFSITIVSFEKPDRFEKGKAEIQTLCDRHAIRWNPLPYHRFPPVLATVFDLFKLRQVVQRLHEENNFSIIHCRSYPTALIGLRMKKKWNVKFVFDMRGFWADERVEGGLWNVRNPLFNTIYKFFKQKEKELVQHADAVVTLTENAKVEVSKWDSKTRISVIPCCVDLALFDPNTISADQKKMLRQDIGCREDDFIVIYLGSLGTWYLYDAMVSFFSSVKQIYPQAKFLFLTPDVDRVEIRDDFIVRTVSRKDVPKYISICQASVCFIKPSFSKRGSSATKMAEVMAMKVPVFTNTGWGDVDFLTNQVNNLHVIKGNDFSEAIKKLQNRPLDQRAFFFQFFSLQSGIETYQKIYKSLISG